jgi:two-component system sensor histidine kinase KdpD
VQRRAYATLTLDDAHPAREAMREGRAVFLDDPGDAAGRYGDPVHGTCGAGSCMAVPILAGERAVGFLGFGFASWRPLSPALRSFALAVSAQGAQALERARLASELEGARVQGETERLRNALLSSVSHDLRSPLASIIGAAGTLANYGERLPDEERRQLLDAILGEGQRLDRYIQNLLDMTRLGHGTLKLNRDWFDIAEIVGSATARLHRLFPELRLETRLPAEPVLVYVHPALIEQALFNILENAARFSPPDQPVRVEVRVRDAQLLIDVSDRGPGIPEDERARIFDMFYSVSRGDRAPPGTGLGLAICRGMIGAHGGTVAALPREGGGTTIRITLPLAEPPAQP